jgi:hypothetical protein
MTHRTVLHAAVAGAAALFLCGAANGALFRAYLSSTGSDANPCTLAAPCRLLPAALAAVDDGGEIWMLDSANYNTAAVVITQSVTILAVPGAVGSVLAIGGNAITVNAFGSKVALRNLVVTALPGGGGTNGVRMDSGAALTIEDCLIAGLAGSGVIITSGGSLRVADSTIRDNGSSGVEVWSGSRGAVIHSTVSGNTGMGAGAVGIQGFGVSTLDVIDTTLDGNSYGIMAWATGTGHTSKVSVRDSRIVRSGNYGLFVQNDSVAASLTASKNLIADNNVGIGVFNAGARVWASGNVVAHNENGLDNGTFPGGTIESAGNNSVRNNRLNDVVGTITVVTRY